MTNKISARKTADSDVSRRKLELKRLILPFYGV